MHHLEVSCLVELLRPLKKLNFLMVFMDINVHMYSPNTDSVVVYTPQQE